MPAGRLVRAIYNRASVSGTLRRPLNAIRAHPLVRGFARRHVRLLLARGSSWANVDGSLRLLAEDKRQRIVFGPWPGDVVTELLYWAPFVRWAQEQFSLDPARLAVISRSGEHWYGIVPGDDERSDVAVFPAGPVAALVEDYRAGSAAPRPLLKRTRHQRLLPPEDPLGEGLPNAYTALSLAPSAAFPESEANRAAADEVTRALSASGPVTRLDERTLREQHALLRRATGLVTSWSGLAVLGVLSGVPTIALRSAEAAIVEPDLDLALRVAGELGTPLTILDIADLGPLAAALGSADAASC
jgi:hypothetical protein